MGDVALNYHPTKFGDNCKIMWIYGQHCKLETRNLPPVSLRKRLEGELVLYGNYRKTLLALRIHTLCMKRFNVLNAILNHYEYNIIPRG